MITDDLRTYLIGQGYTENILVDFLIETPSQSSSMNNNIMIETLPSSNDDWRSTEISIPLSIYVRKPDNLQANTTAQNLYNLLKPFSGYFVEGGQFRILSTATSMPYKWNTNVDNLFIYNVRVELLCIDNYRVNYPN